MKNRMFRIVAFALGLPIASTAIPSETAPPARPEPSLGELFNPFFSIGFGTGIVSGPREELLKHHASSLTCENSLKPGAIRPSPELWAWEAGDAWVNWAVSLGMEPVGHTLVWCYKQPDWLLEKAMAGSLSKEEALAWQDGHIRAVLGRYGDRVKIWDVVNEALSDAPASDERLLRSDPWSDLCGVDYIVSAFRSARAAAPGACLVYNDYNLEEPAKRARLLKLLNKLREEGCAPDAVGIQGHGNLKFPSAQNLEAAICEISDAGYDVCITELDVSVYEWKPGADLQTAPRESLDVKGYAVLPDDIQRRLAERYREIFSVLIRQAPKIRRVSFWNIDDGNTWLGNWPVKGRPNYPLLFDSQQRPKPAFHAVAALVAPPAAKDSARP